MLYQYNKLWALSLLLWGQQSVAQIPHNLTNSIMEDTAIAAGAAYNLSDVVKLKSGSIRTQTDQILREQLAQTKEVVSFSSLDVQYGHMPAGLVTFEYKDNRPRIMVAYHGTESNADLIVDICALKKSNSAIGLKGYSHGGFLNRYLGSRQSMTAIIETMLTNHNVSVENTDFVVTGHSLGGALATLAAADLQGNLVQKSTVNLVTYSSPRVFDHEAAADFNANLKGKAQRFWRAGDPISCVSIGTQFLFGYVTGFKHVGQAFKLKQEVQSNYGLNMGNHAHSLHMRDVLSPDLIKPLVHQGWKSWAKGWASWAAQPVTSIYKSLSIF